MPIKHQYDKQTFQTRATTCASLYSHLSRAAVAVWSPATVPSLIIVVRCDLIACRTALPRPDTIDFRLRFSAECPALLSVTPSVSAECVTSLSAYFRFRPKVKFPLSVDLYISNSFEYVSINKIKWNHTRTHSQSFIGQAFDERAHCRWLRLLPGKAPHGRDVLVYTSTRVHDNRSLTVYRVAQLK